MKLEINAKVISPHTFRGPDNCGILVTPPINENYWTYRVPLTDSQAVVAFPKFCTMGIGFQKETDWNTNLPFTASAESICNHIKHNKGSDDITDEMIVEAIKLLQDACESFVEGNVTN